MFVLFDLQAVTQKCEDLVRSVNVSTNLFLISSFLDSLLLRLICIPTTPPTTGPVLLRGTAMMQRVEHLPPTSVVKVYS